jgi:UDP-2-acetamido-3-amino-2,3-dideoxy-glucuronate N-acetyltransferase
MTNIAIVGCGYWGKNLVRNFHSIGVLTHICDLDSERLEYARREYSDLRICDDYNEILESPGVDAVGMDGRGCAARGQGCFC